MDNSIMAENAYSFDQKQMNFEVGELFIFISNHSNLFYLANRNYYNSAAGIDNTLNKRIKTPT